jgi:translation initiation factor IF-3
MEDLEAVAVAESDPQKEGNQLHTILAPKPGSKKS